MKQILLGLLIFLIIAPVAHAYCDFELQIGQEDTCGNYKIRHDGWSNGDLFDYQIAHFHLWRLSPYADLGSNSIDYWYEFEGKYYDGNKLHVKYRGSGGDPREARYRLEDLTPQPVVVKGNLYYKDRDLNWAPVKWASVHIWEQDPGSGDDDYLGSVLTNESGYFEFGPVENVDWDDDGGKIDIIVHFVAGSSVGCVRDANNETHGFWQGPYPDVTDELCMLGYTPDDETQYKAWWVYDTLCDGWEYLADTVGYGMNYVETYWQWNHHADYLGLGEEHTHAVTNYPGSPRIHLDGMEGYGDGGGSANDPDVIIHEYGHCVMYKIFGDYMPPVTNCDLHYMNRISGPGCAWVEGWANFMPLAVFDDKYYTDTTYWVGISLFGTDTANLETRNGNLDFPIGDSCEGNVAAALWDIYDEHDEMYDRLWDDFNNIWHVLQEHDQTGNEDTFSDFYDSWCDLGHDKPKANSAIYQNDIDYNLPPDVTVSNPEPSHDYLGIIHTLTYTTDEDGDVSQIEIWFSLDYIEWHLLDLPSGKGGYSTRGEEEWYVDWDTTLDIDEDDSVWLRVYATDNFEAVSSDDTDGPFTVDNVAPHHWQDFSPTDWVTDQTPDCTIEVKDITAGLDVSTARYSYSNNSGSSWSGWLSASCTGSDGTTSYQTITASAVPFNHDSGTQNKIKFKIDDVVGNTGYSSEYTVKIDATDPPAPVISSTTHPDETTWYSNNDPCFNWTTPSDTSGIDCYSYILDQSATTTPVTTCEPAGNSKCYTDVADGIWYFHVRAKDNAGNWGDADHYRVKIDTADPEGWQNFVPTDWIADQTPDCTIEVRDMGSGLDVSTAYYKYSINGGSSWSGWTSASCTGSNGTTSYQTITAGSVPFNQDSGTQNKIKFKIDDVVGNTGYSSEYTVKINSTSGPLWTRYSSRIDTETQCLGLGGFAIDSEDNVIIASNRDVIKYDSSGNLLWEYDMCGCGVVVDKTDDSVIVGLCNSSVIKFSKTGSIQWTRALQEDLYLSSVKSVNPSGDILVSGFGRINGVFQSYYEIRDKNGNYLNSTTRPQNGWWPSAAFAESGHIYLAYDLAQGVAIEKVTDDFSSTLWTATLHNCSQYVSAMGIDSGNNLFARGTTGVGGVGCNQYTAKINGANGDLIWEEIYDSGYQDFGGGLTIDSANNILVIGSTDYATGGKDKAGILMIKYDGTDGTELKHILYRKSTTDERFEVACGIVRDSNGYVYIGGKEYDISAGEGCGIETRRALTIKYDPI